MDHRYRSVRDLGRALRRGETTAAELAEGAIDALDRVGRPRNAVATLLPSRAAEEARRAQARLASPAAGPLTGIPYAAKDIFAARGGPTTWGSRVFADRVIDEDSEPVARLRRADAVLTAKLALSEFAGGGRPFSPGASMHGQGRNPWDPARYSGGSSSGSGIAVALGLVPFALGTETGGSILGPAAFSGVTGVRTTFGLVPTDGVMTLSWTLDKVGPLARSADDCALVLQAISGKRFKPVDPAGSRSVARRVRVAWWPGELEEAAPDVRSAVAGGVDAFLRLTASTVEVAIDRTHPYIEWLEEIVRVEGAFERRALLADPGFRMSDDRQLATLRSGLEVPSPDYLAAVRIGVPTSRRAFDAVFDEADVILSASRPTVAPVLDAERPPRDRSKLSDLLRAAGNLAGVPGVSFPCGLSSGGLPVGLQLIGPRGSDALLLALVDAFQQATSHHLLRPPDPS